MSLRGSWHLLLLGLVVAAAVAAAVLELGPPTSSARTSREIVTAAKGVVQTTVSGTGNVAPGTDVEANFQTSGTLQHVYIKDGDNVVKGQLIATLDPSAAQSTLDQAQESLDSAEDQLTNAEEATVTTTTDNATDGSSAEDVAFHPAAVTTTVTQTVEATTTSTPTTTSTTPVTTTTTTPATTTTQTTPTSGGSGGSSDSGSGGASRSTGSSSGGSGSTGSGSSGSGSSGSGSSSGSSSSGETAATKAADIASAQASVDGAEADVTNAETALHETHLYAPATGTVVSVESVSPGDSVSGSSSSSSSSAASSDATSSGSTGATSAGSLGGSTSSGSSSTSSTSSGFAEIVNSKKMTMTVAFSESDISKVKVGQPATVTMEALTGVELGAHVSSISQLGTTSDSVVSYDATLTIDQHDSQVKPGMSASASVITAQAQGVTLPNTAVSTRGTISTVNELRNGKTVSTPIVVGVQGDSRTLIVSGLKSGAQVVVTETLPSLGTSSTASGSSASGTLGGATSSLGAFPGAGGGGGFGGGGGGGFRRGAGG